LAQEEFKQERKNVSKKVRKYYVFMPICAIENGKKAGLRAESE